MTIKPFEIQGAQLKLGGVQLEAGTNSVVIPGITQAVTYKVDEVKELGRVSWQGRHSWQENQVPEIIDFELYSRLAGLVNRGNDGYVPPVYVAIMEDSLPERAPTIEEIKVEYGGVIPAGDAVTNTQNGLWFAWPGESHDINNPGSFVASNWALEPGLFPRCEPDEIETIGGGGGATSLENLEDVQLEGPVEGSVLTWNADTEKWENRTPSGSGSLTISDGNEISVSNVNTILIDSNNFVAVGEGVVGLTNLGGGGSTTKTWFNPNENTWRIEEYNGGAAVSYEGTPITSTITATATETLVDVNYIDIDDSTFPGFYGGNILSFTINGVEYQFNGNQWLGGGTTYRYNLSPSVSYNTGDTITATIQTGSNPPEPVVWWDAANSTNGNEDFRGAIIEYHAYCDRGTAIGKIIIAADDENAITHMEAMSGSSSLSEYEFWYAPEYGQVAVRRIGTDATENDNQIWIQWTSKIFYGSEYYC